MSVGDAIYAALSQDTPISNLVGSRVYRGSAPQLAASPRIVFSKIGRTPDTAHDGRTGCDRYLWEVRCIADTPEQAEALSAAVQPVMVAINNSTISAVIFDDDYDLSEPDASGGDRRPFQVVLQFIVWAA